MNDIPVPRTVHYGSEPGQSCELYLPAQPHPAVVCLLHGGFWRMPYGREQLDAVARDLAARGHAVWNVGYRRIGAPAVGWSEVLEDVAASLECLARLVAEGVDVDPARVIVAGHSAGGHLALWLAAQQRQAANPALGIHAAIGLAAVSDLVLAWELGLGGGAAAALLGGAPAEEPQRYATASPFARLPLGVPQLLLHGGADTAVPSTMSERYVARARAAGDDATLQVLPDVGHMEFLDPHSTAHAALCAALQDMTKGATR